MKKIILILNLMFLHSTSAETTHLRLGASPLSDEFDGSADLLINNTTDWEVLGSGLADERATNIEISNGWLTVVPQEFSQNAWFEDEYGPLVYKTVSGNFSVMTHLRVESHNNPGQPPSVGYNAGGFVIRDAMGTHSNNENWVMYNMGGQGMNGVTYAREVKKTVNSVSNLFLTEQVGMEEYLLVCRVGSRFYFYYWADAINGWREEHYYNQFDVDGTQTTTWHNSSSVTPEITPPGVGASTEMSFDHALMPNTVQVGVMGHTWSSASIQASFDYVRFATQAPSSQEECVSEFDPFDLIFKDGYDDF